MSRILILVVVTNILICASGQARDVSLVHSRIVPGLLNYQGYLTDTMGVPVNDASLSMTFSIWSSANSGSQLWYESQNVSVSQGVFSVLLGINSPIPDSVFTTGANRWIALTVAGSTLSPRTRIASAGYAHTSTYSDTAEFARHAVVSPDSDWTVSDNILHPYDDYGLSMRSGNLLYGDSANTHVCFGVKCTTGVSSSDNSYATVSGGYHNSARGCYSTVSGGTSNKADSTCSFIGGGNDNTTSGSYTTVGGGYQNLASSMYATVAGGHLNTASDTCATVAGGLDNTASSLYTTVAGGRYNNSTGDYATVGGGFSNAATNINATVGGGYNNDATGQGTTVGGGYNNTADSYYSTVGGGLSNTADYNYSTVCGGYSNTDGGYYVLLGGGYNNTAGADYSVICGGRDNSTSEDYALINGGQQNTASGTYAIVNGGFVNVASGGYATVGGGRYNTAGAYCATISGGYCHDASSDYAAVAGGYADTVAGSYGFATNFSSQVLFGHYNSAAFTTSHTTAVNQVRAASFSTGTLVFSMDHPHDPMHKILNQHAVGSDEAMLMYSGSAILDADGRATVTLPDYFDDINRNPRIQLTGVGSPDVVYVAEKIHNNRFMIGGKPGMEIYWQITAERKDIHAEIARIQTPVVQQKTGNLLGHSLDDDVLIGIYDMLQREKPGFFAFKTEEGRRVNEQMKILQEIKK